MPLTTVSLSWSPGEYSLTSWHWSCKQGGKALSYLKDKKGERASRYLCPFFSSLCPPLSRNTGDVIEGGGKPVIWLNCFSLPASMEFLFFSTSVNRGEHMGLGDSMFHGLFGCQNVLYYYLLQHSRWSSLRKKKPVRQVPRCPCWEQMSEQEHC